MEKYRLHVCPAFEVDSSKVKEFYFKTKAELIAVKNSLADMLLFLQDDLKVMEDYSNSFDCQKLVDGEWIDIEDTED